MLLWSPSHPVPWLQHSRGEEIVPFQQLEGSVDPPAQLSIHSPSCARVPSEEHVPNPVPPAGAPNPTQSRHASPPWCPQWQTSVASIAPTPSATNTPDASCKLQRAVDAGVASTVMW